MDVVVVLVVLVVVPVVVVGENVLSTGNGKQPDSAAM